MIIIIIIIINNLTTTKFESKFEMNESKFESKLKGRTFFAFPLVVPIKYHRQSVSIIFFVFFFFLIFHFYNEIQNSKLQIQNSKFKIQN